MAQRTRLLEAEWRSLCPDGYDMFEWEDLFGKDKSLWSFILEEVEISMVEPYAA
jgi:hypothetical protein